MVSRHLKIVEVRVLTWGDPVLQQKCLETGLPKSQLMREFTAPTQARPKSRLQATTLQRGRLVLEPDSTWSLRVRFRIIEVENCFMTM
jgi:hypothetical protein